MVVESFDLFSNKTNICAKNKLSKNNLNFAANRFIVEEKYVYKLQTDNVYANQKGANSLVTVFTDL